MKVKEHEDKDDAIGRSSPCLSTASQISSVSVASGSKQKREQSPGRHGRDPASLLASELVQLHMQLEEKRRAIEAQKKKMEALSARQRLKLGKAAFLPVAGALYKGVLSAQRGGV
ncbi:Calmodulin-regulated spectrin-associated protein 1 [Saguinus oedipus]|uniref:Calmodulin-regulated spectrin-associated protein 1 n=1 Tax=Saguinus oedipus TaxID=9490 RepID=A0ABQ9VJ14_SAGOE|nr:Calmodulin-regulated spectrin-associated protein 1 [Saguinus oedipus]